MRISSLHLAYLKQTYSAILICTSVIFSIYAFSTTHFFKQIDSLIYNQYVANSPAVKTSDKILLIEADNNAVAKTDEIWSKALQLLLDNHAKAVVFTFLPQSGSAAFYQQAVQSEKTFFARRLFKKLKKNIQYTQLETVTGIDLSKLQTGILAADPYENGIYATQQSHIDVNGQALPTLEFLVTQKLSPDSAELIGQSAYHINFSGGISRLPSITLERVLQNGLTPELVQGRVVMIGFHDENSEISQYITPVSSVDNPVSAFFYHAFALDTLLSGNAIQTTHSLFKISLFSFVVLSAFFYYQWLSIKQSFWVTLTILLIYIVFSWIALHFFQLWLPLFEISIAQCLMFFFVLRHKAIEEDKILHSTLFDISIKLKEKLSHANFLYVEDHWQQVIIMVSQTLDTNRMIFLEKIENDHRVREIKALNCNLEDIDEVRRDYERAPYSTAININSPMLVHNYFKKQNKVEDEYLVALMFAGEVLGFWAFTITSDKINFFPNFMALIKNIGLQISEILHYRRVWQQKQVLEKNVMLNYLSFTGGQPSYEVIKESVDFLDKRAEILEGVFDNIGLYSILYDLFGRVIFINKPMKELAQKIELKPYSITIVDFIAHLTGHSLIECRSLMRYVVLDREEVTIPATALQKQGYFMLLIKPLLIQHGDKKNLITPFQIEGVLCELVDYSSVISRLEIKEQFFERTYYQIRTDFSAILVAVEALKNNSIHLKTEAENIILNKINSAKNRLEKIFSQSEKNTFELLQDSMICYPIDSYDFLSKSLDSIQDKTKNIRFTIKTPEASAIAFVSPGYFKEVIESIFYFLIEDTLDEGEITIDIKITHLHVIYKFRNTGFGMPNEALQKYLNNQEEENNSDSIKKMRKAISYVKKWNGNLEVSSSLGEGMTISMILKVFIEEKKS